MNNTYQKRGMTWLLMATGLLLFTAYSNSYAEVAPASTRQDLDNVRQKIREYLTTQSMGAPGKVEISINPIDPTLKLNACPAMEVFMPAGSRAWGKTSVGVRCNNPVPWTIYVQANVSVMADYLVAATPLAQGQVVAASDVVFQKGDLSRLPPGIYTDANQVIGRTVKISLTAGTVLRQEMLRIPPAVQQGQTVTVTSSGKGFRVSAEGLALGNAAEGQIVQVKVASGQVVSGIARGTGQIEVGFQ